MLSQKAILRISGALAIIGWVALIGFDLIYLFWRASNFDVGYPEVVPDVAFVVFVLSLAFYQRNSIGKAESINFIDLLWKAFVIGLITTVISLFIKFFLLFIQGHRLSQNFVFINFFYEINIGLSFLFLLTTWVVWKRLILYQKTKWLLRLWNFYEISLYLLLASMLLGIEPYGQPFLILLFIFIALGLVISVNMKWVAYLNFAQKWKAILFIALVVIYLAYFLQNLDRFSDNYIIQRNLFNNLFFLAITAFIFVYSIFSILVLLFNLPTSSVFEQKLQEVLNFQKLSKSIPTDQNEDQVYDVLISSSMSAVFADSAWLELSSNPNQDKMVISRNIDETNIHKVESALEAGKAKIVSKRAFGPLSGANAQLFNLRKGTYKSALVVPIEVEKKPIGELVLLKQVSDGFNQEMGEIITAFASQASVSIENYRLLQSAIENERYREELKIAKRVQQALLPHELIERPGITMAGFSEAAAEVGGDYYDILEREDGMIALMIGDVSGKGTSAAFNMSQMKGVFHSLSRVNVSPDRFLILANAALSTSLERTSFITATYFLIDQKKQEIIFARAGHCPTLYYDSKKNSTYFFENKGLGLGVLRNNEYENYVEQQRKKYQKGDIIVLYTDGITEAMNSSREEFGYEKLKEIVAENTNASPQTLKKKIMEGLYEFCGEDKPKDDYTVFIVKFE